MLNQKEINQMLEDCADAVGYGRVAKKEWHRDRIQGAQKALCVILDLLGSTAKGETSLDCWEKFLETGN